MDLFWGYGNLMSFQSTWLTRPLLQVKYLAREGGHDIGSVVKNMGYALFSPQMHKAYNLVGGENSPRLPFQNLKNLMDAFYG